MIKIKNNTPFSEPIEFAMNKLQKVQSPDFVLSIEIDAKICPQGYTLQEAQDGYVVFVSDAAGAMYALLDLAEMLQNNWAIKQKECIFPFIKKRGIKFNIPLDARTPSYSDASDSAAQNIENMWDITFWKHFLDRMAESKFNVLSLWSLSPFPSMVVIPEYPDIALKDVMGSSVLPKATLQGRDMYSPQVEQGLYTIKKMTIEEKIVFWREVISYAKMRCIKVLIFTWNLFTFGTEHTSYGITTDQKNPITQDYFYHAVKALLRTYPELDGIGITAGENMLGDSSDLEFVANTYGKAVQEILKEDSKRNITFIQRMQMTRYEDIVDNLNSLEIPYGISFKYSQAHMFSSVNPPFIKDFLQKKEEKIPIWLTVRNDDYYMHRWGDPQFAYEYLRNMPVSQMDGFYIGADGYTWGRDYIDMKDASHYQFIDKMWYFFSIWGKLSFQIDLDHSHFYDELSERFSISKDNATTLYKAWANVSRVFPLLNSVHWHDFDFQWYPEACCTYDRNQDRVVFADINEFIACPTIGDGKYASVQEYTLEGTTALTPLDAASEMMLHVDRAGNSLKRLEDIKAYSKDLLDTLDDIKSMMLLGHYYAAKLLAAVLLKEYSLSTNNNKKMLAISHLENAQYYWLQYSSMVGERYRPQVLTRFGNCVNVRDFDVLVAQDIEIAKNF